MIVKTVALLGHKDHGKSTLIGSLLMQTGAATRVRINEAKTYSKKIGKDFEPAFILDSFAEERTGEMTIDTTRAEIKFRDLAFSLIDVPGHEELIKNMISGASYGDIALLLVSAKKDEGIRDQTKRHLFIAKMLGIEKLVVAVNKMDAVAYDEAAFDKITKTLKDFAIKIGFEAKNIDFVPISAYKGENLIKKSKSVSWYKGAPLVETLYEKAKLEEKSGAREPVIVAQGFIDPERTVIGGKVICGSVNKGAKLLMLPRGEARTLKGLIVKGRNAGKASVGDDVAMKFDKSPGEDVRGSVFSIKKSGIDVGKKIHALIFVTNQMGKDIRIRMGGVDVRCNSLRINNVIDTTTGDKERATKPKLLEAIDADLELEKKIVYSDFSKIKELGRFVLYSNGKFAGMGIII